MSESSLPLEGIKVVSMTHMLQGPACVQYLADLGADVVKVERLEGAIERHWAGANAYTPSGESVFYLMAGRNQRSLAVDLRQPDGVEILKRLVNSADVFVENFRSGVLDRLGLSYQAVRETNPGLVYCSLTGYGSTGPDRTRTGQDLLLQAASGFMTLSGRAGDPPVPVGSSVVDQHGATLGALGILAALMGRAHTGVGRKVDSNLLSAALDLQIEPFNYFLNGGDLSERSEAGVATRFHTPVYGVFRTQDGWLAIVCSDGPRLAAAFGLGALHRMEASELRQRREEVTALVNEVVSTRSTAEVEAELARHGIWGQRVRSYEQVSEDPQLAANGSILEFESPSGDAVRVLAHPIQYDGAPPALRCAPPALGEGTADVLSELNFSEEKIRRMQASGVIEMAPSEVVT